MASENFWNSSSISPKESFSSMLFILTVSGFIGCSFLTFSHSFFQIYPFRILLPIVLLLNVYQFLNRQINLPDDRFTRGTFIFLFAWFFYGALSVLWARNTGLASNQLILLLVGIITIMVFASNINDAKKIIQNYRLWLFAFAACIIIALWEIKTGNHLPGSDITNWRPDILHRPSALFFQTNDFSVFMAISIPMVLAWIESESNRKLIFAALIMYGVGLWVVDKTNSRATFLAISLVLTVWVVMNPKLDRDNILKKGVVLLVTILIMYMPVYGIWENQKQQILSIHDEFKTQEDISKGKALSKTQKQMPPNDIYSLFHSPMKVNEFVGDRGQLAAFGVNLIFLSYGFGIGPGNIQHWIGGDLHNWWLQIFAEYGVVIGFGYVLMMLSMVYKLFTAYYRNSGMMKMLAGGMGLGLIGFSLACISPGSLIRTGPFWWMFIGLCLAAINLMKDRPPAASHS